MIEFFINRPKFAIVVSIIMTLAGVLTFLNMPVSLYPSVAPPQVQITAFYPGADHNTIRDTVASVLEQEVNGVERMLYIDSKSSNDGSYLCRISFEIGTDPDLAQTLVQNRVNKAMSKLPMEVKQLGVTVAKVSPSMLLSINLFSPKGTYDGLFLSNYMSLNLRDSLARVNGIGELKIIGEKNYSVRVWVDNEIMAGLGINEQDVTAAIASQNTTISAGKIGENPAPQGQVFQYTIKTRGRLKSINDFANIVVRAEEDGSLVRIKDFARVELGAEKYNSMSKLGDMESPLMIAYLAPGANSLQVANDLHAQMEIISQGFPEDIEYEIAYDSTLFIKTSMAEVYDTLFEAVGLVVIISFLFLQNLRATLIPAIAIPVSLVATFVVMQMFGMDINTITMFGLILAIGVVVDAAIVVIENVERIMHEEHLPPKEATSKAMKEVTAPLIASALVLMAVFVPVSLAPGMVGILYQQFGVTIVASTIISTIVALSLTPALCSIMLKPTALPTKGPLGWFNAFINKMMGGYGATVALLSRHLIVTLILFGSLMAYIAYLGSNMPGGFIPEEDKGNFLVDISLPEASTLDRTITEIDKLTNQIKEIPGVQSIVTANGFSMIKGALATNAGMLIITLDDWEQRQTEELSQASIMAQTTQIMQSNREIKSLVMSTPAIPGLGATSGVTMILEDRLGRSTESLGPVYMQLVGELMQRPEIAVAFSTYTANVPQLSLNIDYEKAMLLGLDPGAINTAIGSLFGKRYVNDYTRFGKNYQVNIMSEARYRNDEGDLNSLYVRAADGEMVRFSSFSNFEPTIGADVSARFNLYNATQIIVMPAPGYSSGEAIAAINAVTETLPDGYAHEWTGQTYQEVKTSGGMVTLFLLAVLFTFLFLVAQYESWLTPFAIMLCVPIGLLGSLLFVTLMNGTLNLYVQIGLVLMIGMACRNAILIVEFAKVLREEKGMSIIGAAVEAAKLRMRAVLMTALSFILGVTPLVLASGAGAASRNTMGHAVWGGMVSATFLGCIFVPVFFVLFQIIREKLGSKTEAADVADKARRAEQQKT
ncbi:efflux RND transporter permease subunit [Thalassotalea sp. PS06]|uniref:efflux RND transporter permease subunit n=1 Tax=Thalassotalea sp. PS06 TaxID=2594005 RepID=UPI001162E890|nr:multidrug efflux RND transporter permease subunit [Thalassotalea sp. PS06]QDP02499.1 multidrug efflux RND transporter permease subunit [Thalassotalea sp. PS06]